MTEREQMAAIVADLQRHLDDPRPVDTDWFLDRTGDLKVAIEAEYERQAEEIGR